MNPPTKAILVTGATGGIGRHLVQMLHEAGEPVRALCRRDDQVAALQARGISAVLGNLDDPASLLAAMQDCDRLFLLTPVTPAQRDSGRHAVDAAVSAGVDRVVHLSTADANTNSAVPWARAPAHTDQQLHASGLAWTILRPTAFMQNILQSAAAIRRGLLPQTSNRGGVGWIDTADIAAVAATVLTGAGHAGCEYVLTGPELLSIRDIADQLTDVLHRRVRYVHLPAPAFYGVLRLTGADPWLAHGLVRQFVDVVRRGQDNGRALTDTVNTLTGTPARTFAQFAADHQQELGARH